MLADAARTTPATSSVAIRTIVPRMETAAPVRGVAPTRRSRTCAPVRRGLRAALAKGVM